MSTRLLLGLEEVLERAGWDRSPVLYVVEGTEVEPTFRPFAEVTGHPCDVLQGMWRDGIRAPEGAIGLALVVEGLRHLKLDEFRERAPEQYEQIHAVAAEEYAGDVDAIQTAVETAWRDMCQDLSPATMPESRRIRVRNSVAVLQTGWTLIVVRDKGGDPQAEMKELRPQLATYEGFPIYLFEGPRYVPPSLVQGLAAAQERR